MATVSEENEVLRDLLRSVAKSYPGQMPQRLASWWANEQAVIATEEARKDAEKQAKISDLTSRIAELQSRLASLTGA